MNNRTPLRPWAAVPLARRPRSTRPLLAFDDLEGRQLLTAGLIEFSGPFAIPVDLAIGGDGNLWVLNNGYRGVSSLVVVAPDTSIKATYSIPTADAGATALTLGPDGNIWFVESATNKVGKVTPQGDITEYAIPDTTLDLGFGAENVSASPTDIVAGPDGALWFTESSSQAIGRITTDGVISRLATPNQQPTSITVGPDHAIWFTDTSSTNTIGRVNADHTVNSYPIPTPFADPVGLTTGPDGALWFVEDFNHAIGRITTAGVVTEKPIRADVGTPQQLAFDASGNLWVTGSTASLVRIAPNGLTSTLGAQTSGIGSALAILHAPDGSLWFTDTGRDLIGRVDPTTIPLVSTDHPLSGSPIDPGQWTFDGLSLKGDVATFYDGNASSTPADFTANIQWGDGSSSAGAIRTAPDGGFLVAGSHTYSAAQTATITATITDINATHTPQPNTLAIAQSFDTSYGSITTVPVSVTGTGLANPPKTPPVGLSVGPAAPTTASSGTSVSLPPLLQTSLNVLDAIAIFKAKAAKIPHAHTGTVHHALSHPVHKVTHPRVSHASTHTKKHR